MERVSKKPWPFDVTPDSVVVTTTYVTRDRNPILYVTHERDDEEGVIWQFHCGNGDYSPGVVQLVRLDEIIEIDPGMHELATLPLGFCARRVSQADEWIMTRELND